MRGANEESPVEEVPETPTTPEEIAATKSEIVPESVAEVTPEVATPAPTTDDDIPDWLRGAHEETPITGDTQENMAETITEPAVPEIPAATD